MRKSGCFHCTPYHDTTHIPFKLLPHGLQFIQTRKSGTVQTRMTKGGSKKAIEFHLTVPIRCMPLNFVAQFRLRGRALVSLYILFPDNCRPLESGCPANVFAFHLL